MQIRTLESMAELLCGEKAYVLQDGRIIEKLA